MQNTASSPRPVRPARRRRSAVAAAGATFALALAACGSSSSDGASGGGGGGGLAVQTAFYPLQWVAEQVGGDHVSVANLTTPGAEPHDLELTPRDVASIADADVVFYLAEFQPAVDDAVADVSGPVVVDAAEAGDLGLTLTGDDGHDHGDEADHEDEAGHEDEADHDHEEEAGAVDPHFWLDPTRLAAVATAFGETLAEEDPDHAASYRENAEVLVAQLEELDGEFEAGLADCASTELVTSHQAFGYLADRYGFEQVGIAGLSPNQEPSAGAVAEVTEFVREHGVETVYFETLVSPDVAETVAAEAGVETAVLDPLEGLTDDSEGADYLEVMRANLENLRAGQSCR